MPNVIDDCVIQPLCCDCECKDICETCKLCRKANEKCCDTHLAVVIKNGSHDASVAIENAGDGPFPRVPLCPINVKF